MRAYTEAERLTLMTRDRRALHQIPEFGYDLFETRAYVRAELEKTAPDRLEPCDEGLKAVYLAAAVNAALAARGLPPRSLDEVRRFVGNGVKNLITRALPAGSAEAEVEETLAAFKAYYNDHLSVHTAPYPGIVRLLKDLRAAGVKIGVNSNKYDAALQYLCREHLGGLYDMALGELEGVPKKPSPAAAERGHRRHHRHLGFP